MPADFLKEQFQKEITDYIPPRITLPLDQMPSDARQALTLILLGVDHFFESIITGLLILLLSIGALAWKPFKGAARWMASPLISSGVVLLGFIHIIGGALVQVDPLAPLIFAPIFNFLEPWAFSYLGLGLALLIGSFFLPKETPNNEKQ